MNGNCETCDVEKQCGYEYKPCDCYGYRKFKPLAQEAARNDQRELHPQNQLCLIVDVCKLRPDEAPTNLN